MALRHFFRLRPQGERHHLMAQANAECRHLRFDDALNGRYRIGSGCRGIARAIGKQDPLRFVGEEWPRRWNWQVRP